MLFFESTNDLTSKDLDWKLMDVAQGRAHWLVLARQPSDAALPPSGRRTTVPRGRPFGGHGRGLLRDDYIDLYEVGINGSKVELTHRSATHDFPSNRRGIYDPARQEVLYGGRLASFAASSFHITPKRELLFTQPSTITTALKGATDAARSRPASGTSTCSGRAVPHSCRI